MLALQEFFDREGAAVWPEVEAQICEGSWILDNLDERLPPNWRPHSLYLGLARSRLVAEGELVELPVRLGGVRVAAWADGTRLLVRGRRTEIERTAATKRRLYRRFLTWTNNADLCGHVAENLVDRVIRELHGTHLWVPPGITRGRVASLLGRPVEVGGPLDAHAMWALDPYDPNAGFIPFAVEVKNVRAMLYPWSPETWDLLAKVAAFPDVIPVLVARRIHSTTFRFFKDIGALGSELRTQLFSHTIDAADFARVTGGLRIHNAIRFPPEASHKGVTRFLRELGPSLGREQLEKWGRAAPICARYTFFREEHDRDAWVEFAREIVDAGLYEHPGWVPASALEYEDAEPDDWWDED